MQFFSKFAIFVPQQSIKELFSTFHLFDGCYLPKEELAAREWLFLWNGNTLQGTKK